MRNKPNPIDVHVGQRLRARRNICGVSQESLGDQVGITFQQIQKYENGANRISASRLWQFANILDCPVEFFFGGLEGKSPDVGIEDPVTEVMATSDGLALNRAYREIEDPKVRKQVLDLVKIIAETNQERRLAA